MATQILLLAVRFVSSTNFWVEYRMYGFTDKMRHGTINKTAAAAHATNQRMRVFVWLCGLYSGNWNMYGRNINA